MSDEAKPNPPAEQAPGVQAAPAAPAAQAPAGAPAAPAAGGAKGKGPAGVRSREYVGRRRGWIREHASDDGFMIFVGVVFVIVLTGAIGYKLYKDFNRPPPEAAMPLVKLFNASGAEEPAPGRIRASYDFNIGRLSAAGASERRDGMAQLEDWLNPRGRLQGEYLICGEALRYKPYFEPVDLSVECDAALARGDRIMLRFGGIMEGDEADYYEFELRTARGPELPAAAQIIEWRNEMPRRSSQPVDIPGFKAQRSAPLFFHLKFEVAGKTLRGWMDGKQLCELPLGDLKVGTVALAGPGPESVVFDNVVVAGTPHADFVKRRGDLYRPFMKRPEPEQKKGWWPL